MSAADHGIPLHMPSGPQNLLPNRCHGQPRPLPQTLLREPWRKRGRVRHKTIVNLTGLPPHLADGFRPVLNGGAIFRSIEDAVSIRRSLAHVAAILGFGEVTGNEMLAMLDWQDGRQRHIEGSLARRQLAGSPTTSYRASRQAGVTRSRRSCSRTTNRKGARRAKRNTPSRRRSPPRARREKPHRRPRPGGCPSSPSPTCPATSAP